MPFPRATLTERIDEALQDIAAARIYDSTTGSVVDATMLQTSPLRTIGTMAAGAAYEEDGYLDWIALQATPWTATEDGTATAWAALKGVTREPATPATTSRVLQGAPGQLIPAGTVFSRTDGFGYASAADVQLDASGAGFVPLVATATGAAGNAPAGTALTPTLTIAGLSVQPPQAVITGGSDIEAFATFRTRYLLAYQQTAEGGAAGDYLRWALAVPGVTRAWILPLGYGPGTVLAYTMFDAAEPLAGGFPQGTNGVATAETRDVPATGDQLAVANAIFPLRPVTALVYSMAPAPFPVPFAIHTTAAVPAAVQAAVAAAIDVVFLALASPLGVEIEVSPFQAAIGSVAGMPAFTLSLAPILAPVGALPVRGAVTYA